MPNELASLYIESNFRKKYESTLQAQQWMSGQLGELKGKMEKAHESLVAYERENQIYALSEGQNVTLQKLGQLHQELTIAESERIAKESQYQLVKSRRLDDISQVSSNAYIQQLQTRLQKLSDDLAEVRTTFGPKYPKVQRLEAQLAEAKTQLEREKMQVANRIESEYQGALKREQLLRQAVDAHIDVTPALRKYRIAVINLDQPSEVYQVLDVLKGIDQEDDARVISVSIAQKDERNQITINDATETLPISQPLAFDHQNLDARMQMVVDSMRKNRSAVVAVIDQDYIDDVADALPQCEMAIYRVDLTPEYTRVDAPQEFAGVGAERPKGEGA